MCKCDQTRIGYRPVTSHGRLISASVIMSQMKDVGMMEEEIMTPLDKEREHILATVMQIMHHKH